MHEKIPLWKTQGDKMMMMTDEGLREQRRRLRDWFERVGRAVVVAVWGC